MTKIEMLKECRSIIIKPGQEIEIGNLKNLDYFLVI